MRKLNKLSALLEKPGPYLAAGVLDDVKAQEISYLIQQGLDIAELRIDLYSEKSPVYVLNQIEKFREIATIATLRTDEEGGNWNGSEQDRLKLFQNIIPHVDAVDIESSASGIIDDVIREAKKHGTLVMVSYHNFETTPDVSEMQDIIASAGMRGADITKIATHVAGREDINRLTAALQQNGDKKLVVIGMGSEGRITRLAFPAYGSIMTFCRLETQTAPGQFGLEEMAMHLRKYYAHYNERLIKELGLLECV